MEPQDDSLKKPIPWVIMETNSFWLFSFVS